MRDLSPPGQKGSLPQKEIRIDFEKWEWLLVRMEEGISAKIDNLCWIVDTGTMRPDLLAFSAGRIKLVARIIGYVQERERDL